MRGRLPSACASRRARARAVTRTSARSGARIRCVRRRRRGRACARASCRCGPARAGEDSVRQRGRPARAADWSHHRVRPLPRLRMRLPGRRGAVRWTRVVHGQAVRCGTWLRRADCGVERQLQRRASGAWCARCLGYLVAGARLWARLRLAGPAGGAVPARTAAIRSPSARSPSSECLRSLRRLASASQSAVRSSTSGSCWRSSCSSPACCLLTPSKEVSLEHC